MRKLSLRETILLYIATLLLIGVGGQYIVDKPIQAIKDQTAMDLASKQLSKTVLEQQLEDNKKIKTKLEDLKQYYRANKVIYNYDMEGYQFEEVILNYIERHNLVPSTDSIQDIAQKIDLSVLKTQEKDDSSTNTEADKKTEKDSKTTDSKTTDTKDSSNDAEKSVTYASDIGELHTNHISINCAGTWNDLNGLLDELRQDKTIILTSCIITDDNKSDNGMPNDSFTTENIYNMSMEFEYYTTGNYTYSE